jgi:Tol biopolymer transport system component
VINDDGTGRRVISQMEVGCCLLTSIGDVLAWSPDGQQIAFIDGRTTPNGDVRDVVVLVGADGSGERVLTDGSFFDWSPDGSRLVVSDAGSPRWTGGQVESYSIYVVNADGSGRRWLTYGEYPAWSPVDSEPE